LLGTRRGPCRSSPGTARGDPARWATLSSGRLHRKGGSLTCGGKKFEFSEAAHTGAVIEVDLGGGEEGHGLPMRVGPPQDFIWVRQPQGQAGRHLLAVQGRKKATDQGPDARRGPGLEARLAETLAASTTLEEPAHHRRWVFVDPRQERVSTFAGGAGDGAQAILTSGFAEGRGP